MRRGALLGVLLAATVFAAPAIASADDLPALPPPAASGARVPTAVLDNVYLRNGGLYRGRVTELAPKDHVTIVVEGGETKRIPWADVDRVIVSSMPVPPAKPATPAAAPAAPAPAPPAKEELAFVHVTTPKPVIVYRRPPGSIAWEQVCASPCDKELPVSGTYRVVGNGVAAKELGLQANPGERVEIKVDPSSTFGMLAGGVLMAAGVVGAVVASEMQKAEHDRASASASCTHTGGGYYGPCSSGGSYGQDDTSTSSAIGLAAGGALIAGVVVFLFAMRTDVTPITTRSAAASAPKPASRDAFVRRPTWRSVSSVERATAAPGAMFPLLFNHAF